jgi:hypothetical protein
VEVFNYVTIFDTRNSLKRQEYPKHKRSPFPKHSTVTQKTWTEYVVASIFCFVFSSSGVQVSGRRPLLTEVLSVFPHSLQAHSRTLPRSRSWPNSFNMSPYLLFNRCYIASLKASLNEPRINKYTYLGNNTDISAQLYVSRHSSP